MKELNQAQLKNISAGVNTAELFESGIQGAGAGAGFGAAVGFHLGLLPGAAVLGGMGAGIGFMSGMVAYALK